MKSFNYSTFIWTLACFFLVSCSESISEKGMTSVRRVDGDVGDLKREGIVNFSDELHPMLVNTCSKCHGDFQAPLFALSDAEQSEKNLVQAKKVNFESPKDSRIYSRVAEEGHNCGDEKQCEDLATRMLLAIQNWAESRESAPPKEGQVFEAAYISGESAEYVPRQIPGEDEPDPISGIASGKRVYFDISSMVNNTSEVRLSFDIYPVNNDPDYLYLIKSPRLHSEEPFEIEGLEIEVVGVFDSNSTQAFNQLRGVGPVGDKALSNREMYFKQGAGPLVDVIQVRVQKLNYYGP